MARFPHGWLNRPGVSGELRGDGLRERTGFRGSMKGSSWESCGRVRSRPAITWQNTVHGERSEGSTGWGAAGRGARQSAVR